MTELRMVPSRGLLLMVGTAWDGQVLLKARLPLLPAHPRAVNERSTASITDLLPDGPAWMSPLVDLHLVDHPRRRHKTRIDGVGNLRNALQLRLPVIL